MNDAVYHAKLAKVLDRMGGLYNVNDILERIAAGRMQSFVEKNSWLITEVNRYPRASTLDCLAVVGDLDDCRFLHGQAMRYAAEIGVPMVRAYGRRGWLPDALKRGWRPMTTNVVYVKDM